jgi:hypothetical protein
LKACAIGLLLALVLAFAALFVFAAPVARRHGEFLLQRHEITLRLRQISRSQIPAQLLEFLLELFEFRWTIRRRQRTLKHASQYRSNRHVAPLKIVYKIEQSACYLGRFI